MLPVVGKVSLRIRSGSKRRLGFFLGQEILAKSFVLRLTGSDFPAKTPSAEHDLPEPEVVPRNLNRLLQIDESSRPANSFQTFPEGIAEIQPSVVDLSLIHI